MQYDLNERIKSGLIFLLLGQIYFYKEHPLLQVLCNESQIDKGSKSHNLYLAWIIHEHIEMFRTAKPYSSFPEINRAIHKNGQTIPVESDWFILNCQGTSSAAIPTVQSVAGCSPVSWGILFYKDNYCTVWMLYILLNGLLLLLSLPALSEWYLPAAFVYFLEVPAAWTNWISCTQACVSAFGWHSLFWNDCSWPQSQIRFCLLW